MPVILEGVHPTGQTRKYVDWFAENDLGGKHKAHALLHSPNAPPTVKIGNTRVIDLGIAEAYLRALAEGRIVLTSQDFNHFDKKRA